MRPRLPALLALALSATLVTTTSAGSVPIPDSPGAENVAPYLGKPATARPLADQSFAPRHPWMAGNGRSNLHDDAYQSDAGTARGPLGRDPEVLSNFFAEECASHTFDREGRLLTVCVGIEQVTLRLLDPDTLDVLAQLPLPPRQPSTSPFTTFGGGGYFYLDHRDRVVVPTSAGTIDVIRTDDTAAAPALETVRSYDVSDRVGEGLILSALPDWEGRIWFVTDEGTVAVVDRRSGRVRALDVRSGIGNSIAVDETGGVFVVSEEKLYRFDAGRHGRPLVTWQQAYDAGDRQKPGQSQLGSGTTPTIIKRGGRRYVAITDNADPRMHVLVFRAGRAGPGRQPVCRIPVFARNRGATDNSLIAFGRSIVVENNYGYTGPVSGDVPRNAPTTEPGLTRIDLDFRAGTCEKAWTNRSLRIPSSVSKASAANGLVYVYEYPSEEQVVYPDGEPLTGPEDPWYLTAIDVRTGRRVWSQLTGTGLGYNNNYAPITLGPDGTAYVGVLGGILAVRDTGSRHARRDLRRRSRGALDLPATTRR